jgi:hypothetical protein
MKDEILNEEFKEIPQPKSHKKIKIAITLIASLAIIATTTLLVGHLKFDWFKSEDYNIDSKNGVSETIELRASTTYEYLDYDNNTKKLVKKTRSNPSTITGSERYLRSGWYVISSNVLSKYRIEISGKVNIILCDKYIWKTLYGLNVESGNELIIYGQTGGTGQLEAKVSSKYESAIGGGEKQSVGNITINGGKVLAHSYGGSYAAGIGAGCYGIGGKVTINGGFVDAFSSDGAGIGGSVYGTCGTTIINGGEVIAESSQGAGIGGGPLKDGGSVSIYGGKVTAKSGYGSGIGGGSHSKENGTLKIGSGVTLYGGDSESSLKVLAKTATDNVTTRTKYMKAN